MLLREPIPAPPAGPYRSVPDFRLVVFGQAKPAGSKRALPLGGKKGNRAIVVDANPNSREWKDQVATEARLAMLKRELLDGPLQAEFTIYVRRPKSHYGTGKNAHRIKASSPDYPTVKPDLLKLARGIEDALTGIVYPDDAQIVTEILKKRYDTPERAEIIIRRLNNSTPIAARGARA